MATKKTVFDAIKEMDEKQFGEILFRVYNAGWFDVAENHCVDRESFFYHIFPGMDAGVLDMDWDNDDEMVEFLEKHKDD